MAYNFRMHARAVRNFGLLFIISVQATASEPFTISTKNLAKASIWEPYSFRLQASGGTEPYHWRVVGGSSPPGFKMTDAGEISGSTDDQIRSEFSVLVTDSSQPPNQARKTFVLSTYVPLAADWRNRPKVNGQRIDGSIKVSNHSGRDFDLTFIVLAINDIHRATAIGYQHFSLKRDTREMGLPFGDTLPPGKYAVNVDVVGEEPISNRIFRARLVSGKEQITQGP
jgi:hypothetical protein